MTKPSKQGKMLIEKSKVEHLRQMNAKQHDMLQDMQTKLHWMRSSLIEVFKQVNFYINPDAGEPDVDGLRKFVIKCTEPPVAAEDSDGSSGEGEGGEDVLEDDPAGHDSGPAEANDSGAVSDDGSD